MTKDKDQDGYDAGANPTNKVLYINMAPFGLNMVVGKDMKNILGFGRSIWQAATVAERERCAKVCEAYAIDRYALYKGRPPYTGKEPQHYDPYTEGASDSADLCADKIRSGE